MTAKLPHRTAVAELIAALVKGNRTMRDLCEWSDMSDETVNAWVREFVAAGLVYVADYRKNRTGLDSPVYGWVRDDEVNVEAPGPATNPSAVRARTNYRLRRRRAANSTTSTPIAPEVAAWQPRMDGSPDWSFRCLSCSVLARMPGSGWRLMRGARVRICAGCKASPVDLAESSA